MRRLMMCLPLLIYGLAGSDRAASGGTIVDGGDPAAGRALIAQIGCGTCHRIPGVASARGRVGPPLEGIAEQTFIAGMLPNTPPNMMIWLKTPQSVVPGNAMPNLGLDDKQARDIAAYLYTLR